VLMRWCARATARCARNYPPVFWPPLEQLISTGLSKSEDQNQLACSKKYAIDWSGWCIYWWGAFSISNKSTLQYNPLPPTPFVELRPRCFP
jgi:hypothetical protein